MIFHGWCMIDINLNTIYEDDCLYVRIPREEERVALGRGPAIHILRHVEAEETEILHPK